MKCKSKTQTIDSCTIPKFKKIVINPGEHFIIEVHKEDGQVLLRCLNSLDTIEWDSRIGPVSIKIHSSIINQ